MEKPTFEVGDKVIVKANGDGAYRDTVHHFEIGDIVTIIDSDYIGRNAKLVYKCQINNGFTQYVAPHQIKSIPTKETKGDDVKEINEMEVIIGALEEITNLLKQTLDK